MKGYWRNPRATQETKTPDGWLKTGDIAYVDDNGKFHVVDRKKVRILCSAAKNRRHLQFALGSQYCMLTGVFCIIRN